MMQDRWIQPLLACAVAASLFGCARNPQASLTTSIPLPSNRQSLWTSYQQLLDRRIASQQAIAESNRLASNSESEDSRTAGLRDQAYFDQRVLAAHNRERLGLGLEPLRWNPALARSARRWADYLASTGRFEHAPENHIAPEGENLWAGTKGYFAPEAMVNAWIREKRYFRPGVFPDNSTTGRVEDVGHYTQLVWRITTQVGCAEARSRSEDILVCRYAEAGNYRGEVPF